MMLYYYVVLFFLIIKSYYNKSLLTYHYILHDSYNIIFSSGTPSVPYNLEVDLVTPYTYLRGSKFNNKISKTLKLINNEYIYIAGKKYSAKKYIDYLNVYHQNFTINNYMFYSIVNEDFPHFGAVSFAFTFSDEKFSIIQQFYNQKLIDKRKFTFIQRKTNESVMDVIYGDVIDEVNLNKNKGKCKVMQNQQRWSCNFKGIKLENYDIVYKNNYHYSFFQMKGAYIGAPKDFIRFLEEKYYKEKMSGCEYKYGSLYCDCECFYRNKIYFFFENLTFSLAQNDFAIKIGNKCTLKFKRNNKYPDNWVFAVDFLQRFSLTFDYDNEDITFYSEYIDIVNKELIDWDSIIVYEGNSIEKYLYILAILIQMVLIIILLYNKMRSVF